MRIALIIERFAPRLGGREVSTAQIAAGLARRGQEVTVLCRSAEEELPGVTVCPLGRRGLGRAESLRLFVRDVRAVLAEECFDVSHAMLPIPGATVFQARGGTTPGNRKARMRQGGAMGALTARLSYAIDPHRRLWAKLERQAVASAQAVLAGSEMVAEEIRRYFGRQEGVHVVFNGVEVPDVPPDQRDSWRRRARDELGVGNHVTVFLTVATNFALKGVDYAIRALAGLGPDVPVHLAVVGAIPSSAYVRLAKRLGVRKRVTFLGASKDIFRWYSAADAVVLLSWYDACSRVVLEATRWSVPSVTTTFNGAAEVLADGAGVVVARPDDTPAVVEAMRSLCDEGQRHRRRTQCEQIADRLSLDRHVSELLRVYEAIPAPKE